MSDGNEHGYCAHLADKTTRKSLEEYPLRLSAESSDQLTICDSSELNSLDAWFGNNDPEHLNPADLDACREQLAAAREEAQMNWAEFISIRERCKTLEEKLKLSQRHNDRLGNRLRRFRARTGELLHARRVLAGHAERANDDNQKMVQVLTQVSATPEAPKINSLKQALDFAMSNRNGLSIPEAVAAKAIADMQKKKNRATLGRKVLGALTALHVYAIDPNRRGDFKTWCAQGNHAGVQISANQVAMSESQNVQQRNIMESQRRFPVDPTLDLSGSRVMLAHIKLGQGQDAPRLYFFDDTRGNTGKVHIGYIGQHLATNRDPT